MRLLGVCAALCVLIVAVSAAGANHPNPGADTKNGGKKNIPEEQILSRRKSNKERVKVAPFRPGGRSHISSLPIQAVDLTQEAKPVVETSRRQSRSDKKQKPRPKARAGLYSANGRLGKQEVKRSRRQNNNDKKQKPRPRPGLYSALARPEKQEVKRSRRQNNNDKKQKPRPRPGLYSALARPEKQRS